MILTIKVSKFFFIGSGSRKKNDDLKRKHVESGTATATTKSKKAKIYSPLSESDKAALEHWNRIALNQSKRGLSKSAEEYLFQQEELIREQNEYLNEQHYQLMEQKRHIQKQTEQIRQLIKQQKILIRECKAAGIAISISTPEISPLTPPLAPPLKGVPCNTSTAMAASDVSGTLTIPSVNNPRIVSVKVPSSLVQQLTPAPPTIPQAPKLQQHMDSQQEHLLPKPSQPPQSIPSVLSSTPAPPPPQAPPPPYIPPAPLLSTAQSSLVSFQPPPPVPPTMMSYPQPLPPSYMPPYMQRVVPMGGMSDPALHHQRDFSQVFSPLTSEDLMEMTSKEVEKLSPFASNSVGGFDLPLPDDIDTLLNLPSGCGAGYGVGVNEEELTIPIPPMDKR